MKEEYIATLLGYLRNQKGITDKILIEIKDKFEARISKGRTYIYYIRPRTFTDLF